MRLPLTTVLALFFAVLGTPAATLNWSQVTWPAGSPSNFYTVSGTTVTVSFTPSTTGLFQPTYPNTTSASIGGTGKPSLQADVQFATGNSITVTIKFSQAVYVQNLNILDVDASLGNGGWQDVISQIKGTSSGQINPVSVVGGGSSVTVMGSSSAGWTATGKAVSNDDSTGNVSVNFGNSPVTQITFLYSPGSGATNPQPQRIGLDNITFSLTPEVGPSLAAITLCGLVVLVRLGQQQKRRNDRKRLLDFMVS
jgi:hypothetical protein